MRVRVASTVFIGLILSGLLACGGGGGGYTTSRSAGSGSTEIGGSPAISAVIANTVNGESETITWTTDVASSSQVDYGHDSNYGQTTILNSTPVTAHSVTLTSLSAGTTYHYRVRSANSTGLESVSADFVFITSGGTSQNPPVISTVANAQITSTGATVTWTTDVIATSQVDYGLSTLYGQSTALDSTQVMNHSEAISGLTPSTLYHYRVRSMGPNGLQATSGDMTFTTSATQGGTNPPVISNVTSANISGGSASIRWTTDVSANSQVEYGTSTAYGRSTTLNPAQITSHSEAISGLTPSTLYHYRVHSTGSNGVAGVSGDFTFTTTAGAPVISNVGSTNVTSQGATITWATDVASSSQVDYGLTTNYGQTTLLDSVQVTSHSESLTGLSANTTYHYRVRSTGTTGLQSTSGDFTLKTAAATGDATPPTVTIAAPLTGAVVSGSITVTAAANDNVGVLGVQFLLDGQTLGTEVTSTPYSKAWNTVQTSNGSHVLTAVARDAAGNKTTSASVTVTVSNGADTTAPSVSIASPLTGAPVSASLTITAVANDNVAVAGVQFNLDGSPLGAEVTSSPYITIFNTLSVTNGSHTLTAVARDAAGNQTTSASVIVSVSNSVGGSTAADADYRARCSDPNVVRCANMDVALPTVGNPTATGFPDSQDPTSGLEQIDTSTKIGSLAGSTLFTQPGDSESAGGKALLNFTPDTSFRVYPGSPTGDEFYIQWRQRVDQNFIDYSDADDTESNKQYILTFGDMFLNSSTWAQTKSCSTGELVQINDNLMGFPSLYFSCADKDQQYQNLFPVRSSDFLLQNAEGCLRSKARVGSQVNIVSAIRSSGTVTVTTSTAINVKAGDMVILLATPVPDRTSSQNTAFNGVHTISAVIDSTHVQFLQPGADQSVSSGTIAKVDHSHCWRYQPNQWMTFQLHVKAGRSYQNDYNYHRDSTVELWAAHEGEPSQLITSMTDYDLMFFDNEDSLGNVRPATTPITNWFANQGMTPGYGRMDFLQYESNRCPSTVNITSVQRNSNVATLFFFWENGAGSPCVGKGATVVVSGTPGATFDGTWISTSNNGSSMTFAQTGPDVAKTSVTGATAIQPRWMINCNGGPCDMHSWFSQFIVSRKRVPDPADYTTTPVPDPPDTLQVAAVDPTSGAVTLQWRDNASNETGFKIEACSGNDRYQCQYLQATSNPWTQVGTAGAVSGRYGTQTFTYTPASNTTLYSFRVKATNAAGDSTSSNDVQNTPLPPSDVTATLVGGSVEISWTRNTPATETGFQVFRCAGTPLSGNCTNSTTNDANWAQVCAVDAGVTTCTDSSAAPSTTYVYRVKSFNNAGATQSWGGDASTWREFAGNNVNAQVTTTASRGGGSALSISTSSLPTGVVDQTYSATLGASGGTIPYTWSINTGSLPAGISLNSSSGAISGTPTATASGTITFKVTDGLGATATKALTLIVNNPTSLSITTVAIPTGTTGLTYNANLVASGGVPPYTWSIITGSLPTGLLLNGSSGVISGLTALTFSGNITVKVSDSAGLIATQSLLLTVNAPGSSSGLPSGIGWHSLGDANYSKGPYLDTSLVNSPPDGQGSSNQCPINGFGGDPYQFFNLCKNIVNAQSSGIADVRRNIFYLWGGGHGDYSGNEVYAIDLNASPVTLRRVKDPTVPTVSADPNYAFQSSCYSALPPDTSTPSYNVLSATRDANGRVTMVFTESTVFVPSVSGNYGKGYMQTSGFTDSTLNEKGRKITAVSTTNVSNDTITYQSTAATATTVTNQGTATATWSSCVPDANGLGCSANGIHSTGNITFAPNPTDPTQDAFFKEAGSLDCGPGNQAEDTWTLPLDGGVSNATKWIAHNRISTYTVQGATSAPNGFPNVTEYDPTTGLIYAMDHSLGTLYAYDLFGTKGAANTWYRITPGGFSNTQALAGVLWHSSNDTQRLFFAAGGCSALPITAITRLGGVATATVPYLLNVVAGTRVVVEGVADSSFNGGDGTNVYSTVTATTPLTVTFNTANPGVGASLGGRLVTCDGGAVHGAAGVLTADVTGGTAATTKQDWTYATLDPSNVDLGNASLGNTCAEFLSGGQNPLNGTGKSYIGGISPGMVIDTVTGNIVGWPNEGSSIYQITPDTANKRWTCKRETYPAGDAAAAPVDTSNSDGPHSTWGTWHRFNYFPQLDVFFLVNAPDQPARILRIR